MRRTGLRRRDRRPVPHVSVRHDCYLAPLTPATVRSFENVPCVGAEIDCVCGWSGPAWLAPTDIPLVEGIQTGQRLPVIAVAWQTHIDDTLADITHTRNVREMRRLEQTLTRTLTGHLAVPVLSNVTDLQAHREQRSDAAGVPGGFPPRGEVA